MKQNTSCRFMWYLKFFLFLSAMFFSSCDKTDDMGFISFIGDSLIARWDTENYFTSYNTLNLGKGGSGIEWIEQHKESLTNQTVVVLTGTNDLKRIGDNEELQAYVYRYINAVTRLNAHKIILVSVLPKNRNVGISKNIIQLIRDFNRMVQDQIEQSETIVYCDVFDDFIVGDELNMNLSYDGVHLNSFGYEILTNKVKECL
ncbi:MAG: SGNH/GDSL hydrolase family protein [Agathobacter sp.]